jgi:hypothetical protein
MNRFCASLATAAAVVLGGLLPMVPASAAPPTVTPSPGYDARLQEQRATQTYSASAPVSEPVVRHPQPQPRHHAKRVHDGAHY